MMMALITRPMTAPIRQMTNDSIRNWSIMLPSVAPIAFLIPISLVRSVTDTSMIFIMPIPPTRRDMAAIPPSIRAITSVTLFRVSAMTFIFITEKASESFENLVSRYSFISCCALSDTLSLFGAATKLVTSLTVVESLSREVNGT